MASTYITALKQARDSWLTWLEANRSARRSVDSQKVEPTITQLSNDNSKAIADKAVADAIAFNKAQADNWVAWVVQFWATPTPLSSTSVSTSTPWVVVPTSPQWNKSSVNSSPWASGTGNKSVDVTANQTNKVVADTAKTYEDNIAIDKAQLSNQKAEIDITAANRENELKQYEID